MSARHPSAGLLINRNQPRNFTFNGKRLQGFAGDTLASALLANGQLLMGRSFKYHRPRSVVAAGVEEPNALVNLGEGANFEPNQRATTTELVEGLKARSQNHWPSLEFDIGSVNNFLSRFLTAGFYYKTFLFPRFAWKYLYEPFIRQSAGLGQAPKQKDEDRYAHHYHHVDMLIVGGGVAGLLAAEEAGLSGARVMLLEQNPWLGGRALVDAITIDGQNGPDWVSAQRDKLMAMENVTLKCRVMGAGIYDHGYVLGYEQRAEGSLADAPRHILHRIRAKQIITATGAIERPIAFAGNDIPGVMLASAMRDYLTLWGVNCGDRTVIVTNNDSAYETALQLVAQGLEVPAIIDVRDEAGGALPSKARAAGIRVETGKAIAKVQGRKRVESISLCAAAGEGAVLEEIACDAVAMSGGFSPVVHLWSHCGGKLNWDDAAAMFVPDPNRPPLGAQGQAFVHTVGAAAGPNGHTAKNICQTTRDALRLAAHKAAALKLPKIDMPKQEPLVPLWLMPAGANQQLRMKAWLDYQNDVKVSDLQLAAREGFESVEHAKRYTTLGMATDQGKLSNINGLAILADALASPIPQVGTTTFRPPYAPISMASIAGDARGALFKPIRKTAMDGWHADHGAIFEPVANWRRPYSYLRAGESVSQAVQREILNTRERVGMLDASTLGKILVKGPDAGKFLDLLYTNMMSNLKIGKCRYGLMCNENGFLFDDGVVVRLDAETFLCHTTSGGSDHVHGWMEQWLQTEWWNLKVYTANITEQYGQIAVVGPQSRILLEKLGGVDVSPQALPFMGFVEGSLAGHWARIHRISFSGELSYEIAVNAGEALAIWGKIAKAGEEFGIMPYGTEALHVMRAEKGFIMIGDETDGTVTPLDLHLNWAVSKKKQDFIGKRGMMRPELARAGRKQLVGLLSEDPQQVLQDGAHAIGEGQNEFGQQEALGHVTSSYFSPTLGRSIAMALIKDGAARMGEVLTFTHGKDQTVKAKLVSPVFYDQEGAKQNV